MTIMPTDAHRGAAPAAPKGGWEDGREEGRKEGRCGAHRHGPPTGAVRGGGGQAVPEDEAQPCDGRDGRARIANVVGMRRTGAVS